mmetsp:Transcript_14904/g.23581  ORF Transcript_14904/g.23581 Transcript_14904/m.23581 type:complete len:87 (+) Transcript_14904:659-919(+)
MWVLDPTEIVPEFIPESFPVFCDEASVLIITTIEATDVRFGSLLPQLTAQTLPTGKRISGVPKVDRVQVDKPHIVCIISFDEIWKR